ncbi:alpha/beta hydrolase [Kribbella sp. NPDC050820]|uniref:alpha/beta hydrolase family protein n=1 Tax=Kribbella sp. NPDC050820 TaxID=3155408 RepID=UPI0033D6A56E
MTATRLGAGRYATTIDAPTGVATSVHELGTSDGAKVTGVLRIPRGATAVVTIMHPRQDVTHHPLVPYLLTMGYGVWTQGTRSPNNDLNLLHEQAIIDFAAGHAFLRERGFDVCSLGHSGGGTLAAFYCQQASLAPDERLTTTPSGRPVPLADTAMPLPDGCIFLAPHPGQGALLQRLIDPSVADESDPLLVDPELDPFNPANGFRPAPESSSYDDEFITRYRAAQEDRVRRLDAKARVYVSEARQAKRTFESGGDAADRRRALAPRVLTVFRTDADLRNVDLSLDPNDRPYGSLFGRRPDLTNYGLVGFARLSTAEAWLSTWSALSTNATFLGCAPGVAVPTLLVEFTGDQASYPIDITAMSSALGASDLTVQSVPGTHFGGPITKGAPTGTSLAAATIESWLRDHC